MNSISMLLLLEEFRAIFPSDGAYTKEDVLAIHKQGLTLLCLSLRVPGYCEVPSACQKRRRDQNRRTEDLSSGCRAEWRSKGTRVLRGVTLELCDQDVMGTYEVLLARAMVGGIHGI